MACGMSEKERENFKALAIAVTFYERKLVACLQQSQLLEQQLEAYQELVAFYELELGYAKKGALHVA